MNLCLLQGDSEMKGYEVGKVELKRFYLPEHMYFITKVTEDRRKIFVGEKNPHLLLEAFGHYRREYRFKIVAFCILPDHFHWLIIPSEIANVSKIMKGVLGLSARRINGENNWQGRLWQHQFIDHVIRKGEDYQRHIDYIHNNAVKHGLVDSPGKYPWSSYRSYCDDDTLFEIDRISV